MQFLRNSIACLVLGTGLTSCGGYGTDFLDVFNDEARIDCDVIAEQHNILVRMERVAVSYGFRFTTAIGRAEDGRFIASMGRGHAQVFLTNNSFDQIVIISTFAPMSDPTDDQRQQLADLTEELAREVRSAC